MHVLLTESFLAGVLGFWVRDPKIDDRKKWYQLILTSLEELEKESGVAFGCDPDASDPASLPEIV